jgi:hypothetical protein
MAQHGVASIAAPTCLTMRRLADAGKTSRGIVLFWLPLAATWLMMALELPYIAALVARMPEAAYGLAAFGVATSLAWLIESPIMMLLSAGAALVRDRASYLALRRFAFLLNALVTLGMIVLATPAVFRVVGQEWMGLPAPIANRAQVAISILILWPASIGYRRFYQGILVRNHLTRRVAYGTVIRLVTMSATAALVSMTTTLSGATLGAIALVTGVLCEAVASRAMAHGVIRDLMSSDEIAADTLLTLRELARFYFPLALTSMLSMAVGPLVTFGLGRGRAPIESLAVWPVVNAIVFIFRSGGVAFQEVGIALHGPAGENAERVRRTALWVGTCASLGLALLAFTPLETVWFVDVSGLSRELATFAIWPLRILAIFPLLEYLLSIQRVPWIISHRTRTITVATAIEAGALVLALVATLGGLHMVGAIGGAIALVAGRLAANAFLSSQY